MDLTRAERLVPILRIVDPIVTKLLCARRHPDAKRLGEALQRLLGNAECLEARIADPDRQPGIGGDPRVCGRIDIRCQPAEKCATRLSIVDAQEHVSAEVRRRPGPEDRRLDLLQVERRRARRRIPTDGFLWGQHGRIPS